MDTLARYAKVIGPAIAAGLTVAESALPLTPTQHAWVAIALAVASAIWVHQVPNKPAQQPAAVEPKQ